jgi:hypothetical protein
MTKLEKHIYNIAMEFINDFDYSRLEKYYDGPNKYITIAFRCDGVWDFLVYNKELKKFEEIKYTIGIGKAIVIEYNSYSGFFDEIETKIIKLK